MSITDYFQVIFFAGSAFFTSIALALFIIQKTITTPLAIIKRYKPEEYFYDPNAQAIIQFPSIDDEPSVDLSVIIPAYEEEKRLPLMLDECMQYLERRVNDNKGFTYEVIVVSDGSRDGTVTVAHSYTKRYSIEKCRVLELIKNRGKGGAVRLGMLSARGRHLLFADADGATKFEDYEVLEHNMKTISDDWRTDGIAIGSRAQLEKDSIATRNIIRTFLMYGFHFLVWLFAVRGIRDTQCGFKLLTRTTAKKLFKNIHVERWAFDVELLYLVQRLRLPFVEVPVHWTEIEGSKLTPVWSWLQMGIDLFLIWFRYTIGAWRINVN